MLRRSTKGTSAILSGVEQRERLDFTSANAGRQVRTADRLHVLHFTTGRLLFGVQQRDGAIFTYAASRSEMWALAKLCLRGWWQMRRKGLQ